MDEFEFKYKDYGCRQISINNGIRQIIFIDYSINNDILEIYNITRNFSTYELDTHFGTIILNQLLIHLQNSKIVFNIICGTLSTADAYNNNWLNSIPFYMDFPNYLDKNLHYKLFFHLYDSQKREIYLSNDIYKRKNQIKKLQEKKLKTNTNLYFKYLVEIDKTQK